MSQDFLVSIRKLLREPRFAVTVIFTLALGLGAATTIFSVLHAALLEPLPYPESDRLISVRSVSRAQGVEDSRVSMGDFVDLREHATVIEPLVAVGNASLVLTGAGDPEEIPTAAVTTGFFELLGALPVIGRSFDASEETPGRDQVIVLSHGFWQRRFGGDPSIIGRILTLSDLPFEVVGIAPRGFDFPRPEIEIWSPMSLDPKKLTRRRRGLDVIGRLRPNASISTAQLELESIADRLSERYPETNSGWSIATRSLRDHLVTGAAPALALLLGATALLLLIACANIANLMLMRALRYQHEAAVRSALGAPRKVLIRQALLESLLLGLLGGGGGLLLAFFGLRLVRHASPHQIYGLQDAGIDGPVMLFAVGLSMLTGLIVGVLPAIRSCRVDINRTLRAGRGKSGGGGRAWAGEALIVTEIAIALVLLIASGLLINSFFRLTNVDPGFRADKLLIMPVLLPPNRFPEAHQQAALFDTMLGRIAQSPAVISAASSTAVPMSSPSIRLDLAFDIEGRESASDSERRADIRLVSPGYFRTMGIPLADGRDLTARDHDTAREVALINQAAADRYWPNSNPIGKHIKLDYRGEKSHEVIGIVANVRSQGLALEPRPEIFLAAKQYPFFFANVVIHTRDDPMATAAAVRSAVWEVDSDLALSFREIDDILSKSVADRRFTLLLLVFFSAVALILTILGVYGMMAAGVAKRTNEIGVRLAMGAKVVDLLWLIFKRGLIIAGIGAAIGTGCAFAASTLMTSFVYQVGTTDVATFVLAIVVLFVATVAGILVPARRAIQLDPVRALHYE